MEDRVGSLDLHPTSISGLANATHISISGHRVFITAEPCNLSSALCIIPDPPSDRWNLKKTIRRKEILSLIQEDGNCAVQGGRVGG